jgi:hypothetical protein
LGGFNIHIDDFRKPDASTPTRRNDLHEFIDNLNELLLPDLAEEIEMMSVFYMTSTPLHQDYSDWIQTDLRRLHSLSPSPTWRRTWIVFSRFETRESPPVGRRGGGRFRQLLRLQ